MAVKYSSRVEEGCSNQRAVVNCVSCVVDWCYTLDEVLFVLYSVQLYIISSSTEGTALNLNGQTLLNKARQLV